MFFAWCHGCIFMLPSLVLSPAAVLRQEETAFGNINRENIAQIWNGKKWRLSGKTWRMVFLTNDARVLRKGKQGLQSLRQITNKNYFHHYDRVNQTLKDGQIPGTTPVYFDIRFSNVCNLRCRICRTMVKLIPAQMMRWRLNEKWKRTGNHGLGS